MLPVSLNDPKGKNEGIKLRISDILKKCLFEQQSQIQSRSTEKTHSRFAMCRAKLHLSYFLLRVSE